jgi:L-alanine-DL-glutamate epimerase-like enolase superfamily enzyme
MALGRPQLIKDSMFQLPKGPGLGLEIDPDFMRKHTPKGEDWA